MNSLNFLEKVSFDTKLSFFGSAMPVWIREDGWSGMCSDSLELELKYADTCKLHPHSTRHTAHVHGHSLDKRYTVLSLIASNSQTPPSIAWIGLQGTY
jgi:hypothetical protein